MWQKIKKIICSEAFMYLFIGGCTTLVNLVVFSVLTYGTSLGNSDRQHDRDHIADRNSHITVP